MAVAINLSSWCSEPEVKTMLLPNFSIFAFAVKIPGDPDATNATLMLNVNGLYSINTSKNKNNRK